MDKERFALLTDKTPVRLKISMKYIAVLILLFGFILGNRSVTFEPSQMFAEVNGPSDGNSIDSDIDPLDQEIARLEKQFDLSPARNLATLERGSSRFRIWIAVFSRIQPGCMDFVLSDDQSIRASYLDYVRGQIVRKEILLNNDARVRVRRLFDAVLSGRFSPDRKRFSDPDEALVAVEAATVRKYKRISFRSGTQSKEGKSVVDLVKSLVGK